MAQSARKFEPSTLPDPELNPLENPLLSANMGRWAHVYYTTPPEQRDQAVHELLCELQGGSTPRLLSPRPVDSKREENIASKEMSDPQPDLKCGVCGHENPPGQKFCGMCGVALPVFSAVEIAEVNGPARETNAQETAKPRTVGESEQSPGHASFSPSHKAVESDFSFPMPTNRGIFFPPRKDDLPSFAVESEPENYRRRIYIGAALAILLAAVLYITWRRPASSDNVGNPALSSPAPQETSLPSGSPQPTFGAKSETARSSAKQTVENPSRDRAAVPVPARKSAAAQLTKRSPVTPRSIASLPPISSKSAPTAGKNGAEDFSVAQKYLDGNAGAGRNATEAAQWLWKAVGNGSVPATVALADLYLHGEGVPKSCDQGRLLLDAAARKGSAAASERLRNLPAFGCQ